MRAARRGTGGRAATASGRSSSRPSRSTYARSRFHFVTQSSWPSSSAGSRSSAVSVCSQRSSTCAADLVAAARLRARSRRRTCARAAGTPTASRSRCSGRATRRRPSRGTSGRATPCASPGPGSLIERSLSMKPSSIIASTIAVAPTLRNVATSHRFASPTITCSRRYFCGSACGSSRVFTIGRFSVVSSPTSSSKKSARWLIWKSTGLGAVLGADLARAGEHLPRDEPRDEVAHERRERHRAVDEEVLVAAVRVALAVAVVLVDDDLLARRQQLAGRVHRPGEDALPRLVEQHDLQRVAALGRGVLGVRVVDVVARAVGEHRVDEMRLDLGRLRAVAGESARVAAGRLVFEVPADAVLLDVAVDQEARRDDRDSGRARRGARRRTRSRCRRSSGRPRGQSTGGTSCRPARAQAVRDAESSTTSLASRRTAARRAGTTASRRATCRRDERDDRDRQPDRRRAAAAIRASPTGCRGRRIG